MSYGQPCRRITPGPLAGPASAYPIFKSPASICFRGPNDALAPAFLAVAPASFNGLACASLEPKVPSLAAAMVMAAVPKKRRRLGFVSSETLIVLILVSPLFDLIRSEISLVKRLN